jgi:Phosphotransferase enzyme family
VPRWPVTEAAETACRRWVKSLKTRVAIARSPACPVGRLRSGPSSSSYQHVQTVRNERGPEVQEAELGWFAHGEEGEAGRAGADSHPADRSSRTIACCGTSPESPSVKNKRDLVRLVRRVFPRANAVSIEPASERLVVVYRACVDDAVFYLRVTEQPGQDLTTDAQILDRLGALGASVPAVVAAEATPRELPMSYLIVTEIPGDSLAKGGTDDEARRAARRAGGDTAIINSLEVSGFGWVQRNGAERLTAELDRYGDFVMSYLPQPWPGWLTGIFEPQHLAALEAVIDSERRRPVGHGQLAHGDLDVTHIYVKDSAYTGIIDFGEMRGTEQTFDASSHCGSARNATPHRPAGSSACASPNYPTFSNTSSPPSGALHRWPQRPNLNPPPSRRRRIRDWSACPGSA